jgi:hypothetical protein
MYEAMTPPLYDLQRIRIPTAVFYAAGTDAMDIEGFLLDPTVSYFNSVVSARKLDASFEALYLGLDMTWFSKEVIPLIEKYDNIKNYTPTSTITPKPKQQDPQPTPKPKQQDP